MFGLWQIDPTDRLFEWLTLSDYRGEQWHFSKPQSMFGGTFQKLDFVRGDRKIDSNEWQRSCSSGEGSDDPANTED